MLGLLGLIWGATFLLIKVGIRDMSPSTLVFCRLLLGTMTLGIALPFVVRSAGALAAVRTHLRWLVPIALVNNAVPLWLMTWGETRISSSLAAIVQGGLPLFNALVAFLFFRDVRVAGLRLIGIAVGFAGVVLIVGVQPHARLLGALALVGSALCVAVGTLLAARHLRALNPTVVAFAATAISLIAMAPSGIQQAPHQMPGWKSIAAVVALGIPGTGLAYLLWFALIGGPGAAYATLVSYLIPPIALAYGAIFLGERVGLLAFGGLALILFGIAVGAGVLTPARLRQRAAVGA
jgi:drug/metabolite transporter (DMT)-like permease